MHIMKLAAVNVGGARKKKESFDFLEFYFYVYGKNNKYNKQHR